MISRALQENHLQIHRLNRAQIIKDSLTLARANLMDYPFALDITRYLLKETEFIPWSPAIAELTYLGQMLQKTDASNTFKTFMIKLLVNLFERLGLESGSNDEFMNIQLRVLVAKTLCGLEYEPCVQAATQVFQKGIEGTI